MKSWVVWELLVGAVREVQAVSLVSNCGSPGFSQTLHNLVTVAAMTTIKRQQHLLDLVPGWTWYFSETPELENTLNFFHPIQKGMSNNFLKGLSARKWHSSNSKSGLNLAVRTFIWRVQDWQFPNYSTLKRRDLLFASSTGGWCFKHLD